MRTWSARSDHSFTHSLSQKLTLAKSAAFNLSAASTSIERWQISVSCPFSPSMTFMNRTTYRAIEASLDDLPLFVFVGFSNDRRLALVVRFGVVVVVIIVIVGVSRRHRVAHDGD